ncbi:preprotein translocase subunit SecG [Clostridium sp. MSJ-8]|uniref:preprotein translocase subunit SecG n=1 Tax=Clostridium sp. MSJ-8 TaxID=2841510 RepID=UPI001C0E9617|nr:preprotein translocase subunit SecG [Clostridium sp. MSJ-8]
MRTALLIVDVIIGLVVIVSILLQPSKSDALSGLIQGSNNESFYSKNKSRTKEVMLERLTVVSSILFVIVTLVLNLI